MGGVGTWQYDDATAGTAVVEGFKVGMRHVDTALGYRNQNGVGAALKTVGLDREEYFVTSKIPGGTDFNETTANLELALQQLDLKYVDLMLLHYPATWGGQGLGRLVPLAFPTIASRMWKMSCQCPPSQLR